MFPFKLMISFCVIVMCTRVCACTPTHTCMYMTGGGGLNTLYWITNLEAYPWESLSPTLSVLYIP